MKLYFLCLSALTVGALCKINDVCIVQSGKKGVEGKCQKKSECMKAGLAAFSRSGRTDISGTVEEFACPGEDEEVQCCVEIKCGSHTCRNNVESNPCAEGAYVANFRDRTLCPSFSSEDNVQCCVENPHSGLKRRDDESFTPFFDGGSFGNNLDSFNMASAEGPLSTTPDSLPTTHGFTIASNSADSLNALPLSAASSGLTMPPSSNTDIAMGRTIPNSNFNLAQVENYSQSSQGMTKLASTPNEGVSIGLNHGLRPQVTYTNGGGSTFSLGPSASVPSMLENLGSIGSSFNGIQGGFSMGFRKLKRSLADAFK